MVFKNFSDLFLKTAKEKRITQREMATMLGVSYQSANMYVKTGRLVYSKQAVKAAVKSLKIPKEKVFKALYKDL